MRMGFDEMAVVVFAWSLIIAPIFAWLSAKRMKSGRRLAPKVHRLRITACLLALAGLCSYAAVVSNDLQLGIRFELQPVLLGLLIAAAMVMAASRGLKKIKPEVIARRRRLNWPDTATEYRWTLAVSVAAGIGEELVYRGALYGLLFRLTDSAIIAGGLSIAAFAVAHLAHGRKAVMAIAYVGFILQLLYLFTGNLLVTIILHTVYDIGIFTLAYRLCRNLPAAETQPVQEQAAAQTAG